jgi:hypothetical protein
MDEARLAIMRSDSFAPPNDIPQLLYETNSYNYDLPDSSVGRCPFRLCAAECLYILQK